ncbi:phage tail protein [Vibrio spartinae]|uniref:P2 Phage tail completion protein R (GpR) n=1 Tax=Vibrio spartinae TaxID=1918945 RepID=A0A1N6MAJ6_9VIBR|nr:phage tail protein [Vibrio spartinae]QMV16661.1 P2 phage tail completion protein R (GpR) [Vibrio spartinae]SIO96485.1 P2 phage tail completion protein R (GpR) [Vibrio spartinae]
MAQYEAGDKLRELKTFITTCVGDEIAQTLTTQMKNISLSLDSQFLGNGCQLLRMRYHARLVFNHFPHLTYSPAVLFANVGAWLMDHDSERETAAILANPVIEMTTVDETYSTIIIEIEFEEPVSVTEDTAGPIYWRGKQWRIDAYEIWVAETLGNFTTGRR